MEETARKSKAPAKPSKTSTTSKSATPSQTASKAAATNTAVAPGKTVARSKASTTRKATTKTNAVLEMTASGLQAQIAELAHRFWTERGRQHGHHEEDWYRAEREIFAKAS